MAQDGAFGPKVENTISRRSLPYAFFACALSLLIFYVLWVAQSVLVPLVTAIFLSFLIMSVKRGIDKIPFIGRHLPDPIAFMLAFVAIATIILLLALIVRENIGAVLEKAPEYQAQFITLAENLATWAEGVSFIPDELAASLAAIAEGIGSGIATTPDMTMEGSDPAEELRRQAFSIVQGAVGSFTAAAGGLVSGLITTFLYTAFILLERGRVLRKIKLVAGAEAGDRFVQNILDDIARLVRAYISIKTLISLIVACMSFVIMSALGTDFAGFWALLIFAFGFVPIVGAVIAISLPTILTLVAPDGGLGKAVLTLVLLTMAEQSVSSFIEPRLLGRSLNLSPLVILLSLATWGTLWGFPGMLLCIPITVTIMIVLSQFEVTRPVAIMLSDNGEIAPLQTGHTHNRTAPADQEATPSSPPTPSPQPHGLSHDATPDPDPASESDRRDPRLES